ncbi:MAG: molybdate ABC transporter permease subunit [Thermoleophilia bacterium]|nr:molybdate ABC transporter permease subunit [Thermoleophilia bacterium]MDH3724745.1 molybdate ABC transporter permease subunit [Thermoleophilia bacterium]
MSRYREAAFATALVVALSATLLFLLLPVVAIFTQAGPGELIGSLARPEARDALEVSLRSAAIAMAIILTVGTPAAYLLATRNFPGRELVITAIELPIVLPPAVAGIGLLAAFGPRGALGEPLSSLGLSIPLTSTAVVLAMVFVSAPLHVRQAQAAFAAVDPRLRQASHTLGATEFRWFTRAALPLATPGLGAGATLALGRSLGEFGATLMFAGSLQGVTQTLPLAIFETFTTDFTAALGLGALLVAVSGALLLTVKLLGGGIGPQRAPGYAAAGVRAAD